MYEKSADVFAWQVWSHANEDFTLNSQHLDINARRVPCNRRERLPLFWNCCDVNVGLKLTTSFHHRRDSALPAFRNVYGRCSQIHRMTCVRGSGTAVLPVCASYACPKSGVAGNESGGILLGCKCL